jgi:flagella basal body P-ring formation protein FlgA
MRIVLPVVCLQRGSFAQRINVRDPETRKILQAEVVGVGRLQTTF